MVEDQVHTPYPVIPPHNHRTQPQQEFSTPLHRVSRTMDESQATRGSARHPHTDRITAGHRQHTHITPDENRLPLVPVTSGDRTSLRLHLLFCILFGSLPTRTPLVINVLSLLVPSPLSLVFNQHGAQSLTDMDNHLFTVTPLRHVALFYFDELIPFPHGLRAAQRPSCACRSYTIPVRTCWLCVAI